MLWLPVKVVLPSYTTWHALMHDDGFRPQVLTQAYSLVKYCLAPFAHFKLPFSLLYIDVLTLLMAMFKNN